MASASEISSSFSSRQRNGRCSMCYCGHEAPLRTSWTDENLGHHFRGCGHYTVDGVNGYNFFEWHDLVVHECEKKIIRALLKKNDELKKEKKIGGGIPHLHLINSSQ
ncbi:cyanogenic beta-glucosidase [Spatholobus suberectus]|nr:cyanogenic beta-glucosidase [Spatholobus suberectus]